MLKNSIDDLVRWMCTTPVEHNLVHMIEKYLLAQDTLTWSDCLRGNSPLLSVLADVQDKLGWDNFVAGRLSTVFLEAVSPYFTDPKARMNPTKWCQTLQSKLLQLTHKQWLFRNAHVHYKKLDGLTQTQHEEILARVDELMWTDPCELLDNHKYLLHADFHRLTEGKAGDRQNWIAAMESALSAATYVREGQECSGDPGSYDFTDSTPAPERHATQLTDDTPLSAEESMVEDEIFTRRVSRDLNLTFAEATATRRAS